MTHTTEFDAFLNDLNREHLWYRDELVNLLRSHDLDMYVQPVLDNGMYRWYPQEVVDLIILVNQVFEDNYPLVDASVKCIPAFLLKENQHG